MCMNSGSALPQFKRSCSCQLSSHSVTSVGPSWLSPLNIGIVGAKEMHHTLFPGVSWLHLDILQPSSQFTFDTIKESLHHTKYTLVCKRKILAP